MLFSTRFYYDLASLNHEKSSKIEQRFRGACYNGPWRLVRTGCVMSEREAAKGSAKQTSDDHSVTSHRKKRSHLVKEYFPDFDQRDLDWLIFDLFEIDPDILKKDELHERLENYFLDKRWYSRSGFISFVEQKKEERRRSLIEDISWIDKKNDRLLIYVINRLTKLGFGNAALFEAVLEDISFKNLHRVFSKMLDFMFVSNDAPATKRERLMLIKKMWPLEKTPLKSLAWIDTKNLEQLEWIYEYLIERNCLAQGPFPEKADEYLSIIYASFDLMSIKQSDKLNKQTDKLKAYRWELDHLESLSRRQVTHSSFDVDNYKLESKELQRIRKSRLDIDTWSAEGQERKRGQLESQQLQETKKLSPPEDKFAFLLLMKKIWDQRQFRASQKEHDPYQALSKQAKARLKRLARQDSCTESQMLEKLINAPENLPVSAAGSSDSSCEASESSQCLDQIEVNERPNQVSPPAEEVEIVDCLDDAKDIGLSETTDTESEGNSVIEEIITVAVQDSVEETDALNVDHTPVAPEKNQLDQDHDGLHTTTTIEDQVIELQLSGKYQSKPSQSRKKKYRL